jgi:hypothetical protein
MDGSDYNDSNDFVSVPNTTCAAGLHTLFSRFGGPDTLVAVPKKQHNFAALQGDRHCVPYIHDASLQRARGVCGKHMFGGQLPAFYFANTMIAHNECDISTH